MTDQRPTLHFFNRAIDLAVAEIQCRTKTLREEADRELKTLRELADLVGLKDTALRPESERLAAGLTWAPVAERYLVALLRPLVEQSGSGKRSCSDCRTLWNEQVDFKRLAAESGLSPADAPVVRGTMEWVLLQSSLLEERVVLDWNGQDYALRRTDEWMIVDALPPALRR